MFLNRIFQKSESVLEETLRMIDAERNRDHVFYRRDNKNINRYNTIYTSWIILSMVLRVRFNNFY